MAKSFTQRKRIRKSFGRITEVAPMPNLIEVQKASYDSFLQINVPPEDRSSAGLNAVFESVFPIMISPRRERWSSSSSSLKSPNTTSRSASSVA